MSILLGIFILGISQAVFAAEPSGSKWAYSGSIMGYFVPHDRDFVLPTATADRGPLHLEARYNYEARDTASVWGGLNWGTGDTVRVDFTAMAAGVFGDIQGAAPGYRVVIGWKTLELFTEGEYFMDSEGREGEFYYNWSEISVLPWKSVKVGGVVQKTRAYDTAHEFQRGFLVGYLLPKWSITSYVFNPDEDALVVLGANVRF